MHAASTTRTTVQTRAGMKQATCWAMPLAVALGVPRTPALAKDGKRACRKIAKRTLEACRAAMKGDLLIALGNCLNESDSGEGTRIELVESSAP